MLWADAGDPYAAVRCGNTGDRRHKAAVRYGKGLAKTCYWASSTERMLQMWLSHPSTAAAVTSAASAARCSGLAPCWVPELQEQVGAALLVDPPEQSALKQLGRSSLRHLTGRGSTLLSDVTRREVLLLILTEILYHLSEPAARFYNCYGRMKCICSLSTCHTLRSFGQETT